MHALMHMSMRASMHMSVHVRAYAHVYILHTCLHTGAQQPRSWTVHNVCFHQSDRRDRRAVDDMAVDVPRNLHVLHRHRRGDTNQDFVGHMLRCVYN